MRLLITGDIHLDHDADHEYRWQTLRKIGRHMQRDDIDALCIAGDLVDRKDNHPAVFVNRVVAELAALGIIKPVFLMKGNHDYIDKDCPFFGFLGVLPGVTYISDGQLVEFKGARILMLPHGVSWSKRAGWRRKWPISGNGKPYDLVITHETFNGAKASTFQELKGVSLGEVSKTATAGAPVISGDIHVGQQLGNVLYVGAPHHVRFGDQFEPRILIWDTETRRASQIPMGGIRRTTIEYRLKGEELVASQVAREGDHIKARFYGDAEARLQWATIAAQITASVEAVCARLFGLEFHLERDAVVQATAELRSIDDVAYFKEFCKAKELAPDLVEGMCEWL